MPTTTITASQVSQPVAVGAGSIVTVTPSSGATATVEYTGGSLADIGNGAAVWKAWTKGAVTATAKDYCADSVFLRVTAAGGSVAMDVNNAPSSADLASFTTDWGFGGASASSVPAASLASRKTACALGDSITADAYATGLWTNWGWLAWTRRYLADRIDMPGSRIYAVFGKTVAQVRSEQLPVALAAKTDIAFIHCGTNSLGGATTAAIIADYQAILDALTSAGTFVVVIPIRVHNGAAAVTGDNLLQMIAINRWMVEYCRGKTGLHLVDVNPAFLDFSTGNAQASYLRDGLHDNLISSKVMGKLVADSISPLLLAYDDRMTHLGDVYDAVKNPRGNLLTNGLLAGTGGTFVNSASGSGPTGWSCQRSNGGSTMTAVFSKAADSRYAGLEKTVITMGGTGDSCNINLDQYVAEARLVPGDIVQAEVEIDYTFTSAGFIGIGLLHEFANASFQAIASSWDGYYSAGNGAYPAESGSFILRTDPLVVPANYAQRHTMIVVNGPASGSVNGVVKVGRVSLRKVL